MYQDLAQSICSGLRGADRLQGRPILRLWLTWASFALSGVSPEFAIPPGLELVAIRRELRSLHLHMEHGTPHISTRASWLHLSERPFS